MTALISQRPAVLVRAYAGNWIVDCPLCGGAQLTSLGDRCVDCALLLEVRWPTDEVRYGVERLLTQRPIAHTRNWSPGESLHDLLAENVQHGIGPTDTGQAFGIVGDAITIDTLPAVRRLQIGA